MVSKLEMQFSERLDRINNVIVFSVRVQYKQSVLLLSVIVVGVYPRQTDTIINKLHISHRTKPSKSCKIGMSYLI